MEAAAAELLQRAPHLPAPLAALSAWSFASLKHSSPALSEALAQRAVQLAARGQLRPLDASQLVRAAARLGHRHEAMFRACAEVLQQQMPCLGDSMVVGSLWAFAVAGVLPSSLFKQGCLKLASLPPDKARPLLLLQLFQAVTLLQDAYSGSGVPPPASLPPKLMAAATRQWMFSNRRSPGWRPSRLQAAVAAVLAAGLGLEVQQEALTEDGLFSIDVAVEWKGRRVAVEVDGPAHFTNSVPRSLLGSSLAKQRCLQARGWAVLSVPYFTWADLAQQQKQQQQQQQQQQQHNAAGVHVKSRHTELPSNSNTRSSEQHAAADQQDAAADGADDAAAGSAALAARAQWLAAALDEAVAMADVPKGMPRLRQLIEDAIV
ncbi:hypothetical protein OEZ86_001327 [Tetradesmus obliquus]|nr:hypothetical protein OEZ86_001327 [Tetradesmus obliquus]